MGKIRSENLAKPQVKNPHDVFDIQPMSDLMAEEIIPPKRLIGDMIYINELTIIFGRSGVGKSVLVNQIADAISRGVHLDLGNGIILENQSEPIGVILYDFELNKSQVQVRFNKSKRFINFYRAEIKRGEYLEDNPQDVVNKLLFGAESVSAKCIVIDNISAISGDIEKSDKAVKFMQLLMASKKKGYTIIVIAHTPKIDKYKPLTKEHISGSNKINQLTDTAIGIGLVNVDGDDEYYIIHNKGRNGKKTFHKGNVIHTVITKIEENVIHLAKGTSAEIDLITNVNVDTNNAPNRTFYTLAYLYYGTSRKAQEQLKKVGIEASFSTINHNRNAYKDVDSKAYNNFKNQTDDQLKALLDFHSDLDDALPEKLDHKSDKPF